MMATQIIAKQKGLSIGTTSQLLAALPFLVGSVLWAPVWCSFGPLKSLLIKTPGLAEMLEVAAAARTRQADSVWQVAYRILGTLLVYGPSVLGPNS